MKFVQNKLASDVRKLTPHDLAFGIGRKATSEELDLLIEDLDNETFSDAETVMKRISRNIEKKKLPKNAENKI
jgi:hypothetical protein